MLPHNMVFRTECITPMKGTLDMKSRCDLQLLQGMVTPVRPVWMCRMFNTLSALHYTDV